MTVTTNWGSLSSRLNDPPPECAFSLLPFIAANQDPPAREQTTLQFQLSFPCPPLLAVQELVLSAHWSRKTSCSATHSRSLTASPRIHPLCHVIHSPPALYLSSLSRKALSPPFQLTSTVNRRSFGNTEQDHPTLGHRGEPWSRRYAPSNASETVFRWQCRALPKQISKPVQSPHIAHDARTRYSRMDGYQVYRGDGVCLPEGAFRGGCPIPCSAEARRRAFAHSGVSSK